MKKNRIVTIVTSIAVLGIGQFASASDFNFTPRVSVGVMNHSYQEDYTTHQDVSGKKRDYETTLTIFVLGGTASMGDWHLDAYWQGSGKGSDNNYIENSTHSWQTSADIKRNEYDISLGYTFENGLSVFGGYRVINHDRDELQNAEDKVDVGKYTVEYDHDLDAKGPLLGIGHTLILRQGELTVTAVYTWLNSEQETIYYASDGDATLEGHESYDLASGSGGTNIGIAWHAPVTKKLSYTISVDGEWNDFGTVALNGDDWAYATKYDVEEMNISGLATLTFLF